MDSACCPPASAASTTWSTHVTPRALHNTPANNRRVSDGHIEELEHLYPIGPQQLHDIITEAISVHDRQAETTRAQRQSEMIREAVAAALAERDARAEIPSVQQASSTSFALRPPQVTTDTHLSASATAAPEARRTQQEAHLTGGSHAPHPYHLAAHAQAHDVAAAYGYFGIQPPPAAVQASTDAFASRARTSLSRDLFSMPHHVADHNNQFQQASLLSMPTRIINQIRNGECVNFDLLYASLEEGGF